MSDACHCQRLLDEPHVELCARNRATKALGHVAVVGSWSRLVVAAVDDFLKREVLAGLREPLEMLVFEVEHVGFWIAVRQLQCDVFAVDNRQVDIPERGWIECFWG